MDRTSIAVPLPEAMLIGPAVKRCDFGHVDFWHVPPECGMRQWAYHSIRPHVGHTQPSEIKTLALEASLLFH